MLIDLDILSKAENEQKEPREWRTFQISPTQKARFLVKGLNSKAYRIAQERVTESLRLQCGNLTQVDNYEDTSLAKHMTIIAYHLVDDWEGIFSKETNMEIAFTHANLATVLNFSGDLGIVLHGWILEQATDIQLTFNREIEKAVGKPWSFSDSITKNSDPKNSEKPELDSENQPQSNQE